MTDLTTEQLPEVVGGPDVDPSVLAKIPDIIDMDAHVVEPPDVWSSRLPAKYREQGPRVVLAPAGEVKLVGSSYLEAPGTEGPDVAWWSYEGRMTSLKRYIAAAGVPADEVTMDGITFEDMRPGCWKVADRIADMDVNGVAAQLAFPNYPRFCGQIFLWGKDKELSKLCVEAYNDWMVEQWCGTSGGRLLPLCIVPLWDVQLAAAEVRRNAARGVRAVAFTELPAYLDLPSLHSGYWDPFFAACAETGTVVSMHIGSGTKTMQTAPDAPEAVQATVLFSNSAGSLVDFLFSGVPHRFPDLKLMYAEAQIGWIPYVLDRADDVWLTHRGWAHGQLHCPEPPSTYYRRQVYSCFFKDPVGVGLLDRIGVDNVVFETDYPHQDGTWPQSKKAAAQQFGHLPQADINKIARDNAARLLGL
ncbi:amidohydrolase [Frankia sp. CNm7]|uniref:Amidohydrolase n=1 Tax=Frankia nepalensis TaxID=1836974 RepID=A0A937RJL3_9ACTN|nr:amidohydrolase family protein [Frankia nepalensis]MBL7502786.1 amidohydrolase [Frankia nepalensis]MBL7513300.1 amidohydrolase [Frankia nepalensis]MBL7519727.1 amidohydrolase [Frankia nepalensis]MBL7627146.1 amidohydrolase [Frankia nepalensis]